MRVGDYYRFDAMPEMSLGFTAKLPQELAERFHVCGGGEPETLFDGPEHLPRPVSERFFKVGVRRAG